MTMVESNIFHKNFNSFVPVGVHCECPSREEEFQYIIPCFHGEGSM